MKTLYIIGGFGRVGLAFAAIFAHFTNNKVIVNDTNTNAVNSYNLYKTATFYEPYLNELLQASNILISYSLEDVKSVDYIVIAIGTNVDKYLNPKLSSIFDLINNLMPYLNTQTIILRSTLYPGTTKKIESLLKRNSKEVFIAFCPERVATSKMINELLTLPQVIATNNTLSMLSANLLFKELGVKTLNLNNSTEGELLKLYTNSYRYIKFAIANKFYMISRSFDCDHNAIYDAMLDGYERMKDFPRPGFTGGSCLSKDTLQLAAHDELLLGNIAFTINESMPLFIFREIRKKYDNLHAKTVGILGMAFKGETDDIRDSLSYRMRKILLNECKSVLCTDPYVKSDLISSLEYVLNNSDILILMANHKEYKSLKCAKPIIDISNFIAEKESL